MNHIINTFSNLFQTNIYKLIKRILFKCLHLRQSLERGVQQISLHLGSHYSIVLFINFHLFYVPSLCDCRKRSRSESVLIIPSHTAVQAHRYKDTIWLSALPHSLLSLNVSKFLL